MFLSRYRKKWRHILLGLPLLLLPFLGLQFYKVLTYGLSGKRIDLLDQVILVSLLISTLVISHFARKNLLEKKR